MKFLTNFDLNKNQLINAIPQTLAVLPATGLVAGWQVYYTGAGEQGIGLYLCNGTSWDKIGLGAGTVASLDDIGNVVITSVATGEILKWDGTNWVNNTLAEAGIQPLDGDLTAIAALAGTSGLLRKTAADTWSLDTNTYATTGDLHAAVTVADTATIDFTLTGQQISAVVIDDSISNTKLSNMAANTIKGNNTGSAADPKDLTVAETKTLLAYTKSDVGLANVTNDAQVKKLASSTNGYIPTWNGTTGDALAAGYSVETTLSGASTAIPRADAVKTYVDGILASNDAMVFKGTIGTGGTLTIAAFNTLVIYNAGWSYKVIEAGTIKGVVAQIGDMFIATVDRASGGVNADWTVVQTNIDGAVTGPASAVSGNFASFNGTGGKIIQDSGSKASDFATSGHTHAIYTQKYAETLATSTTSYTITHNLNSQDAVVTVREVSSPYAEVFCDVEFATVNTVILRFAVAPAINTYRIVVIG